MGERSKDLRIPVLESRLANSFEVVHISVSERATSLHHSRTWWMVRSAPRRRRRRPRTSAFASLSYNNNTSENIINVELIKSFCRGGTGEFDEKNSTSIISENPPVGSRPIYLSLCESYGEQTLFWIFLGRWNIGRK